MISFKIRKYEKRDINSIKNIWNSIVDDGESYMYDEEFSTEEIEKMLENQSAVYCGVNDKDEVIGFYILHPNFMGRGGHIANATYGIHKNYRGFGVGRELGKHSIEMAKKLNFKAIQFNAVISTNIGAVYLWESLEFKRIGEIPKAFVKNDGKVVSLYIYHRYI
ncbi:N-acetyltransferase family protein [Clostridium sp.]|uniref:N-acetyltransferase family protein n=1 Tax=Clostridium sp. TaxID=1506 RepID=UPI0034645FA7